MPSLLENLHNAVGHVGSQGIHFLLIMLVRLTNFSCSTKIEADGSINFIHRWVAKGDLVGLGANFTQEEIKRFVEWTRGRTWDDGGEIGTFLHLRREPVLRTSGPCNRPTSVPGQTYVRNFLDCSIFMDRLYLRVAVESAVRPSDLADNLDQAHLGRRIASYQLGISSASAADLIMCFVFE